MEKYEYRGIPVTITDKVEVTDKLKKDIETTIDNRLQRLLLLAKDPTRTDGKIHMRFTTEDENQTYENDKTPYIEIDITDCKGRIWLLDGLKPEDVLESDIEMAKHFWCNPVHVTLTDYGMLTLNI